MSGVDDCARFDEIFVGDKCQCCACHSCALLRMLWTGAVLWRGAYLWRGADICKPCVCRLLPPVLWCMLMCASVLSPQGGRRSTWRQVLVPDLKRVAGRELPADRLPGPHRLLCGHQDLSATVQVARRCHLHELRPSVVSQELWGGM